MNLTRVMRRALGKLPTQNWLPDTLEPTKYELLAIHIRGNFLVYGKIYEGPYTAENLKCQAWEDFTEYGTDINKSDDAVLHFATLLVEGNTAIVSNVRVGGTKSQSAHYTIGTLFCTTLTEHYSQRTPRLQFKSQPPQ